MVRDGGGEKCLVTREEGGGEGECDARLSCRGGVSISFSCTMLMALSTHANMALSKPAIIPFSTSWASFRLKSPGILSGSWMFALYIAVCDSKEPSNEDGGEGDSAGVPEPDEHSDVAPL